MTKRELLDAITEWMGAHRYLILGKDDDGEIFVCPLLLDGSESIEEAISRFRDARSVMAEMLRHKHGRLTTSPRRFDGRSSSVEEAQARYVQELAASAPAV